MQVNGRNPGRSTIDGIGLRSASEGLFLTRIANVALSYCAISDNGGGILVMGSRAGSPAIGAVTSPIACASADQCGVQRAVPCDLGAYEAP